MCQQLVSHRDVEATRLHHTECDGYDGRRAERTPTRRMPMVVAALLMVVACGLLSGCAALTNPVANGVPVAILPEELLAESNEGFQQIPLTSLRQPPPEKYELAAGDTLGVYVEGIMGDAETPPPVNVPDKAELPPSIGYPFPIRQDGTISMPYVGPIQVAGMTIEEAEEVVVKAYLDKQITREEDQRILVTLMRPRYTRVFVIREDSQQRQLTLQRESLIGLPTSQTTIGGGRQDSGLVIELPAYENDVLNALARTGGMPGLESTHEVVIQRGVWDGTTNSMAVDVGCLLSPEYQAGGGSGKQRVTRIPTRIRPGQPLTFRPDDIILENGDIVTVYARKPQFYYTGGLIPSNEYPLPNDYDLTVLEAVAKSRGPILNGGVNTSNLNGALIIPGIGQPSPTRLAVLRQTSGGGQVTIQIDLNDAARDPRENILVQAGDVLILQESPEQAITRYATQVLNVNIFGRFINRQDAQGSATALLP